MEPPPYRLSGVKDHQTLIGIAFSHVGSSFFPDASVDDFFLKDTSGWSGATVYFMTRIDKASAESSLETVHRTPSNTVVLKIEASEMGSEDAEAGDMFQIKHDRQVAISRLLESENVIVRPLYYGDDYKIYPFLGVSANVSRCDYDPSKAPLTKVAQVLAKLHALPTRWFDSEGADGKPSIRQRTIDRDPRLSSILREQPAYSHCWQTYLGLENGQIGTKSFAGTVYEMLLEPQPNEPAGVFGKFLSCHAFHPKSTSGRRVVNYHGDFKGDNMLLNEETNELVPIDFDGSGVAAAVADFGFMLLRTGYLRGEPTGLSNEQLRDQRLSFIQAYLEASGFDVTSDAEARALLLDSEVMTLAANTGLLTNWHECEIALLRGREHPTSCGLCTDLELRPTGSELVDLFAEAVVEMRASEDACEAVLRDGLVPVILEGKCVMAGDKGCMLRKYCEWVLENDIL